MDIHQALFQWVQQNQLLTLIIVTYVVLSALPRPHPDKVLSPTAKYFWTVVDRLMLFSAERVPGSIKLIFTRSKPVPSIDDDMRPPMGPSLH